MNLTNPQVNEINVFGEPKLPRPDPPAEDPNPLPVNDPPRQPEDSEPDVIDPEIEPLPA
jgi:hypothetical protein